MTTPILPVKDLDVGQKHSCESNGTTFHSKSTPLNSQASETHDNDSSISPEGKETDKTDAESPSPSDGQAKVALEDANLRNIWEHTMKDFGLTGKPHRNTAVLMISWIEELDDLHTTAEVNELESVFTELFHYTVVKRQLTGGKKPGFQVSKHLLEFVETYDSDSTLLIVYYAGHGIPGKPGELHLAGNRQPDQKHSVRNAAAWHDAEYIIRDAEGDVLLIFDCCYAGNLLSRDGRSYYPSRSFECIAACGSKALTELPGKESFTSALIWALRTLVTDRKRFTTVELQTKIMNGPYFPRSQFVPVLERDEPCDQRLILAPLPSPADSASPVSTASSHNNIELPQNYLDLRFWYYNRPDEKEIENLAKRFRRLIIEQNIGARRIGWLGLRNVDLVRSQVDLVRNAAQKWRALTLGGLDRKPAFLTRFMNGNAPPPPTVICVSTPPASHTSHSSVSIEHAESHEALKAALGAIERSAKFAQEYESTEMVNHDLRANNLESLKEDETHHADGDAVSLADSFELMRTGAQGALLQVIQSTHPVLRVLAVVSLSVCAWYAFPSRLFSTLRV